MRKHLLKHKNKYSILIYVVLFIVFFGRAFSDTNIQNQKINQKAVDALIEERKSSFKSFQENSIFYVNVKIFTSTGKILKEFNNIDSTSIKIENGVIYIGPLVSNTPKGFSPHLASGFVSNQRFTIEAYQPNLK